MDKHKKYIYVAVIIYFSIFVFSLLQPIGDPDLFWHLKTGEWIWQHKTLPDKDPFSFTEEFSQGQKTVRAAFILKQYWLAQVMMYGFYRVWGLHGIIVFRCLAYILISLILYSWMGRKGVGTLTRCLLLMPVFFVLNQLSGERPNNLSLLFAVIVVYLLEDIKGSLNGPDRLTWPSIVRLPLTMLIWANMHGGFILGDAIIFIYTVSFLLTAKKSIRGRARMLPLVICIGAILISLINPATYKAVPTLLELQGTEYSSSISEMMSPFKYAGMKDYRYILIVTAITLFFLLGIRQIDLNTSVLIFSMCALAFTRVRYIPFLMLLVVPFMSDVWRGFSENILKISERPLLFRVLRYAAALLIIGFSGFLLSGGLKTTVLSNPLVYSHYPEAAVDFIKEKKPEPQMFNDYAWGGFLLWSLYPEYKVFIDGRGLYQSVFLKYKSALTGSMRNVNGFPEWKFILREYNVKMVLVPGLSAKGGGFIRLVRRLVGDNDWSLVYIDRRGTLLFVMNTEKNMEIITKYAQPKILAYVNALEQAEVYRSMHPYDWKAYATLGEIYLYLERRGPAISNFEYAFRLNPALGSSSIARLLEKVRSGQDYGKLLDDIFG